MCIYCTTTNYRKIYENHIGIIPREATGRTYEIHHIDGNHSNNDPTNLTAITLQEHYDIHYSQNDYDACRLMKLQRMDYTPEEISKLASEGAAQRVKDGTHHWLSGKIQSQAQQKMVEHGVHNFQTKKDGTNIQTEKVKNGTHHLLGGKIQSITNKKLVESGAHKFMKRPDGSSLTADRVKNGTHNFLGGNSTKDQLKNGTHCSKIMKTCEHCDKICDSANYSRWHGYKCKQR
jgi:hypothetical protein